MSLADDLIHLSSSPAVLNGLRTMMEDLKGQDEAEIIRPWMEIEPVLFLLEIMKRVDDRDIWFPHGKWATIQAITERVNVAITAYCSTPIRRNI